MAPDDRSLERVNHWLLHELPALAPAWLMRQRWFGGKARSIARVEVDDILWLAAEPTSSAFVVLDVQYADEQHVARDRERYAIMVGIRDDPQACSTIGQLPWQPGLQVVEAAVDGPAIGALLRGWLGDSPIRGLRGGELVFGDATTRVRRLFGLEGPQTISALGLEQSNTSVRVGSTHVLKLFRRLEAGENPELEIGRFLTQTTFRAAPPLEGSIVYRDANGGACAVGALEGWIDNEGDGWSHVVARMEKGARAAGECDALAETLFGLGTTTADFHLALASDGRDESFAPELVTLSDRHLWREQVLAQAEKTFGLVTRHLAEWPDHVAALGRLLLGARPAVARHLRALDPAPDGETFHKVRIHGDFHLGQTLKTRDGFAVIDFEGQPAMPLAERRRKQCALRDVAGMMRSLEYAASLVRRRLPDVTHGVPVDRLREAFAEGYGSRALSQGATFLPATPAHTEALVALFELEKALYEVEYEMNNRPAWVPIPLSTLGRLLGGATS